jgi:hypothetical protein
LQAKDNWIELTKGLKIDIDAQKIEVPIKVVNHSGGLEFLVTIGTDKDYESVFAIKCSAKELHLAMETVGFKPLGYLKLDQEDFQFPKEQLSLSIKFKDSFKPITDYILWNKNKAVEAFPFYFCGSTFRQYGNKKEYAADLDLNVIAAYASDSMVIGPLVKVANPYQDENGAYLTPNTNALPPLNTIGWLLIQKYSP